MKIRSVVLLVVIASGLAAGWLAYFHLGRAMYIASRAVNIGKMAQTAERGINFLRYLTAPKGEIETEAAVSPAGMPASGPVPAGDGGDWPSYNKTLTSNRFSSLDRINRGNVGSLKLLCTYDTGQYAGFNSGLIEIEGALVAVTAFDIFSIDARNCHENWRQHEDYTPAAPLLVNRGAAYMDGVLYRGTQDGRVLAYDFKTGRKLWQTVIADGVKGESVPAAPIVWQGLVFVGNAGGDIKGVKGRMYALDGKTGRIVWEFYLVPKAEGDPTRGPQAESPLEISSWRNAPGISITGGATWTSYTLDPETGLLYVPGGNPAPDFAAGAREGENLYSGSMVVLDARTGAYRTHFKIVPKDWHDWDVSSPPAVIKTAGGRKVLSVAPKDGHLYGFDLSTGQPLYRSAVTRVENADKSFSQGEPVHFCPGSIGGAEWNGPAYDPETNLVMVGEVDWCTTVTLEPLEKVQKTPEGAAWSGEDSNNPFDIWGKQDPVRSWGGWLYASDADTGLWKWRIKSNYPLLSGVTPTAGGLVFFGDMGGTLYAVDAVNGRKLWSLDMGGAIGGGVITYRAGGSQKVAVASGLTGILWPTRPTTAKVSILGLAPGSSTPDQEAGLAEAWAKAASTASSVSNSGKGKPSGAPGP